MSWGIDDDEISPVSEKLLRKELTFRDTTQVEEEASSGASLATVDMSQMTMDKRSFLELAGQTVPHASTDGRIIR